MPLIWTIGHTAHAPDRFVGLLRRHRITHLVDVRSVPASGRFPHFSRASLETCLRRNGINYRWRGYVLGGRPDAPECLEGGFADYEKMARYGPIVEAIERLAKAAGRCRIVLMCAEADPLLCHRGILLARMLKEAGCRVSHIHPDGELESQEEMEARMLEKIGLPERDLFRDEVQALEEGYTMYGRILAARAGQTAARGGRA